MEATIFSSTTEPLPHSLSLSVCMCPCLSDYLCLCLTVFLSVRLSPFLFWQTDRQTDRQTETESVCCVLCGFLVCFPFVLPRSSIFPTFIIHLREATWCEVPTAWWLRRPPPGREGRDSNYDRVISVTWHCVLWRSLCQTSDVMASVLRLFGQVSVFCRPCSMVNL